VTSTLSIRLALAVDCYAALHPFWRSPIRLYLSLLPGQFCLLLVVRGVLRGDFPLLLLLRLLLSKRSVLLCLFVRFALRSALTLLVGILQGGVVVGLRLWRLWRTGRHEAVVHETATGATVRVRNPPVRYRQRSRKNRRSPLSDHDKAI
jgi:hypothetical protein